MAGLFIVLDGIDGAGRSTQTKKLGEYLEGLGREVLLTHEPTEASEAGRQIRRLLQSREPFDSMEMQKLFVADRAEHIAKIKSWLDQSKTVL